MHNVSPSQEEGASRGAQGAARFKQGEKVGNRFVIDERLREDVVGPTYRAVDERTGRKIALLMLNANVAVENAATERLLAAIKSASSISHKNIATIFGMGKECKGKPRYIAQEWIDGANLVQLFEEKASLGKHFSLHGAYNVIAHICNVLNFAPMVHGTLRPSVVLLTREGRVKVADFGMAELRADMLSRRSSLSLWDAPCLRPNAQSATPTARDDIYALGVILYCLLTGKPFPSEISQGYEEISRKFSPILGDVLRRILDDTHPNVFTAPRPVKRALAEALESCAGAAMKGAAQDVQLSISSTIESADTQMSLPVVPDTYQAPQRPNSMSPRPKPVFDVPDLKPKSVQDEGQDRWLVTRDGVDFGPYKTEEILRQLMDDRVSPESMLFDILTERRLMLSEFPEFDEFLADALLEKADRTKQREEAQAKRASRRRSRVIWGAFLGLVLLVGGIIGGYVIYQAAQPKPEKARLNSLVVVLPASLPVVSLPEDLPETAAELLEKQQKAKQEAAQRALAAEARQLAKEDRLLAQSEARGIQVGTGKAFDRAAFDRILAKKNNAIIQCLSSEARRNPSKKSYAVTLTIIPSGTLLKVQLDGGTAQGNRCVRQALSGLKVPAFDGSNYKISLPYNME